MFLFGVVRLVGLPCYLLWFIVASFGVGVLCNADLGGGMLM